MRKGIFQVLQMYVTPAVLLQNIVTSEDFLFPFSILPIPSALSSHDLLSVPRQ